MDGRGRGGEQRFKVGAAFFESLAAEVALGLAEEIEEHDGGWGLLGEEFDPGGSGMDAELERFKIEMAAVGDDEFAVENAVAGELGAKRVEEFGEIAVEGFFVAALDEDFVTVFEDEDAEAVPLGLEEPVAGGGDFVDAPGEHGRDGRIDSQVHGRGPKDSSMPDAGSSRQAKRRLREPRLGGRWRLFSFLYGAAARQSCGADSRRKS
jgi:hypothetical protein